MKTITVKNVSFQFDVFDNGNTDEVLAQNMINKVNEHLNLAFSDNCPCLMCVEVQPEQIEVYDDEIYLIRRKKDNTNISESLL